MRVARLASILACLCACIGCEHSGRVLVVVDTDFAVPMDLDLIRASVRGSDGRVQNREFLVERQLPPPHQDPEAVPLSFLIVPRESGSGDFEVTVSGHDRANPEPALVTRRAITGFISGRTLVLPMELLRSCAPITCNPDETCRDGSCVDPRVPPEELDVADQPGRELPRDSGASSMDARIPDGGSDARPADGGARFDGGTCTFTAPTMVLDHGQYDWDPTVTEDGLYLVFRDGPLHYATRTDRSEPFAYAGLLPITGVTDPIAPAISADGLSIVVEASVGGGAPTLYELRRTTRSGTFTSPLSLVMNARLHEPGLDITGLHMVVANEAHSGLIIARRTTTSEPFVADARALTELDAYLPRYPCFSADALTVAFATYDDIAFAHRETLTDNFDSPVLIDDINTSSREHDPWIMYDLSEVYFTVEQPGVEEWDIYVSRLLCI